MKNIAIIALLLFSASVAIGQCGSSTNVTCVQDVVAPFVTAVNSIPSIVIPSVTAGDSIVILQWSNGTRAVTPVSSLGNVYSSCGFTNNYNPWTFYYSCWIANSSVAGTETVTLGTSTTIPILIEGIELNTGGRPIIGDVKGFANQHTVTSLSATTTSVTGTDALVIGQAHLSTNSITFSIGSGFTALNSYYNTSRSVAHISEWTENTPTSGGQTCTATQSATSSVYTETLCIALKVGAPTVANPVISPVAGTYFAAQTVTITDGTSGSSIYYCVDTNNTCTPTTPYSSFSVSSTSYVRSKATKTSLTDSGVVSTLLTIALPAVTLANDDFSTWFNPDLVHATNSSSIPYQFPLDAYWTQMAISTTNVAAWTTNGSTPVYPYMDSVAGARGIAGSNSLGYSTRTAEQYNTNQFSSLGVRLTSGGSTASVGVRCGTGSFVTGDLLDVVAGTTVRATLRECNSGACVVLASSVLVSSLADADVFSISAYGTYLQVTQNGVAIPGMTGFSSSLSGGAPCVGSQQQATSSLWNSSSYFPVGVVYNAGGVILRVTTAGTSGSTAPTDCGIVGCTVTDGTVVWTSQGVLGQSNFATGVNWNGGDLGIVSPPIVPIAYTPPIPINYNLGGNTSSWSNTTPWFADGLSTHFSVTADNLCCNFSQFPTHQPVTYISYRYNATAVSLYAAFYDGLHWQLVTTAGTTGGSTPVWNHSGGTTTDGTAVWTDQSVGQYAVGSLNNAGLSQMQYEVPITDNQWIHAYIALDTTAWTNRNWFLKLQSASKIPPTSYLPTVSSCYDTQSIYIGTEPMYQGYSSCGNSVEYCNTNFLHVTYNNNFTSTPYPVGGCAGTPNYNVWTAFGAQYVPMHGDEILAKIENNNLTVYCKDGDTTPGWPGPSHQTQAEVPSTSNGISGQVIEVNGLYQISVILTWPGAGNSISFGTLISDGSHWQKVTTAGATGTFTPTWNHSGGTTIDGTIVWQDMGVLTVPTTGTTQPTVWGETATSTQNGATIVDGTTTWQYVGESCPSNTAFSTVGSATVLGFSGGFPGLWTASNAGTGNPGVVVFQDIRLGNGDPCGALYTCTESNAYTPALWMQ